MGNIKEKIFMPQKKFVSHPVRIKTPRCALLPPGFLLELFVSVSLFLFVLNLLTHVDLIIFISPVISAFVIVEFYSVTPQHISVSKIAVSPKLRKGKTKKKKKFLWGEEGRHRLRPCMQQLLGRGHQWCVSQTPNNSKAVVRMTRHCFLRPIRRDLTSSSHTTPALPLFSSHALMFTRHSYDQRAWNRLLHPRLIQPESGVILGIVSFNIKLNLLRPLL